MAVETPVVVTRGIPIHAQIDRESAGLVVDRTPRTIADGIERILGDETFAAKLGLNGRVLVEAEYSWGEVSRRVEELYRDAIGRSLPIPASHGRVAAMNGLGAKCE
jgi:glycosyltransferase involved in cell wall biosynthesis